MSLESCAGCGIELPPMRHQGRARKWCSSACRSRSTCRECGQLLTAGQRATCSDACRKAHSARRANYGYRRSAECARCGGKTWRRPQGTVAPPEGFMCRPCRSASAIEARERRAAEALAAKPTSTPRTAKRWPGGPRPTGCECVNFYCRHHKAARDHYMATFRDGDPCARCGCGMTTDDDKHLDHSDDHSYYLGLSHAGCNVRHGREPVPARSCEVCGDSFKPKRRDVRTCGRACGLELRRRNAA